MCEYCINPYYIILFYIFNIPIRIDESDNDSYNNNSSNNDSNTSYQEFLPNINTKSQFTDVDLHGDINPLFMRR